ncbi:MAG: LysM peptidoglycan-binding domain-containing protein [Anaerolineae bacterium]|jgi:LysM repeat protein
MKERPWKFSRHWISLVILVVSLMPVSYALARTSAPSTTFQSPPPAGILGYHTVQPGETLYCIGRAYGVDPYAIASENGIVNPNLISVGMVLGIPDAPKSLPPGRVCPPQFGDGTTPPPECRFEHVVVCGDNLYRISIQYGVSMYAIADANGITNLNLIYKGQVLCIP